MDVAFHEEGGRVRIEDVEKGDLLLVATSDHRIVLVSLERGRGRGSRRFLLIYDDLSTVVSWWSVHHCRRVGSR